MGSARAQAGGVQIARDLANCPPNMLYPESYADHAVAWQQRHPKHTQVTVIGYDEVGRQLNRSHANLI